MFANSLVPLADSLVSLIDHLISFTQNSFLLASLVVNLTLKLPLFLLVMFPKGVGRVDKDTFITLQVSRDVRRKCKVVERRSIVGIRESEIRRAPVHEDLRRCPVIFRRDRPDV